MTQVVAADKKAAPAKPALGIVKTSSKEAAPKETAPKKVEEKKVVEEKKAILPKGTGPKETAVDTKKSSTNIGSVLSNAPKVMKGKKKNEEEKKQALEEE